MFEIEDISLGHQDFFTVKYPSSVNGCPASNMDLYLGSSTFQEMLDIDIKNEMDNDIFGSHDLTFNFADISDVEEGTTLDQHNWYSNNSNHSNSNLFEFRNEGASKMVNPNSVMPINVTRVLTPTLASSLNTDLDTPSPKRSHLTFSPASIEINSTNTNKQENQANVVKKDLTETLENTVETTEEIQQFVEEQPIVPIQTNKPILPKPIHILTTKTVSSKTGHSLLNNHVIKISSTNRQQVVIPATTQVETTIHQSTPRQISHSTTGSRKKKFQEEEENPFPKPTYSYSCLIAMALKNSRTGSLPVSEIYNFMCEHFPYFKTAPTGWKNSVRHNLSLNKCFEKIEKPAVSGSQRKGCLWAMHPDKISKMDEEVQKWSRKDPAAIRRAMVYPDQLEALERGELKYGSESYGDSSGSGASDSEVETEAEDENNVTIREETASQGDFIEINSLGDSYDEASLTDYDNEIGETVYEGVDVETDDDALRMEIALAQQELFNYQDSLKSSQAQKRMRLSASANVDLMYQPVAAGRRKTPLIVRNNSNTSFIEIIGE